VQNTHRPPRAAACRRHMGARRMANRRFVKPIATPHVTTDDGVRLHSKEIGAGTPTVIIAAMNRKSATSRGAGDRCLVATSHPGQPGGRLSRHPFHELPNVLTAPHRSGLDRCYGRAALERRGTQSRPLRAWREPLDDVVVRT
jgi:hypothetical protein